MDGLAFPHKALTKIVGQPTPLALQRLRTELIANAMAVPSTRGGGINGHLCLLLTDEEYEDLSPGVPFDAPVHPGPVPDHHANATNAQIAQANSAYDRLILDTDKYLLVQNALRAQILEAVEPIYYDILRNRDFGFARVKPIQILQHLQQKFGKVTTSDLRKNLATLGATWNPDDPIDTLWTRVRECQDFALGTSETISDDMAMLILLDTFAAAGVMAPYINEWKRRETDEQTYEAFQRHFTKANKVRVDELTTKTAGFQTAHAATLVQPPPEIFLAAPAIIPPGARPAPTPASPDAIVECTELFYCWTHGLGKMANHTSKTCNKPAAGHKTTATAHNCMGGNREFHMGFSKPSPRGPSNDKSRRPGGT